MNNLVLIYTTFSSLKEAKTVSEELLSGKLIVCVNIFPEVNSLYLWKGEIDSSCEVVAIMKSKNDQVDKIVEKIEAMHSYDQPAIAVMSIEKANKSFTNWANSVIDVSSIGVWPSGKAAVFDTVTRRFESFHPSHIEVGVK